MIIMKKNEMQQRLDGKESYKHVHVARKRIQPIFVMSGCIIIEKCTVEITDCRCGNIFRIQRKGNF